MNSRFGPDGEGTLLPNSVKLLVVLVADSSNFTRSLTLSNIAAFSQLREIRASFLVIVEQCANWIDVHAAATATLGMRLECVERPPHLEREAAVKLTKARCANRNSQTAACSTSSFRLKPVKRLTRSSRARRRGRRRGGAVAARPCKALLHLLCALLPLLD